MTTAILKVSKGSVLEWGCGGGWNLVPFADAGFHTIGVDFDDTYVRAGARINSLDLRQISDETLAELSRLKFDVVILNHVLEHSVNPLQLLIDLRSLCTASTHLIVGLPTIESMSIWGFSEYFHIAHLDYYCRSSFVRLAAQAGFLCVYMEVSKGLFVLVPSTVRKIPVSRRNVVSSMSMVFRSWLGYFVKHQIIRMARITRTEKALRSIANRPNK